VLRTPTFVVDTNYGRSNLADMKSRSVDVGPLEMEILGVLNSQEGQSVADIQNDLKSSGKDLAYTTVMTVLVRLFNKDLVTRQKSGRQFLYSVATKRDSSPVGIFDRVCRSLFGDERLQPLLALLDNEAELTVDELKELRKQVNERLKRLEGKK
jgi:predicted transcriptional regulator